MASVLTGCRSESAAPAAPPAAQGGGQQDAAGSGTPATSPGEGGSSSSPDEGTGSGPGAAAPTGETAVEELSPLGPPGSFAPAFLRPRPASRLVVELLVEQDGLQEASIDHLSTVLEEVTGKPVRPVVGRAPAGDGSWTGDDLRAAADTAGEERQGGGQAVMRILVVKGGFAGSDDALGVSVRGDVAAVFVDRVRGAGGPLTGSGRIEQAVVLHEAGHLLGLVDLYLHTGRQDSEHPGHSTNRASVMYWAVESDLVTELLGGGPPTEFDAADRTDLARIRGEAG